MWQPPSLQQQRTRTRTRAVEPIADILSQQMQLQQQFMNQARYLCSQSNASKLRWIVDYHKAEQPDSLFNMYHLARKTGSGSILAFTPDTFCGVLYAPDSCTHGCPGNCLCQVNCLNTDPTTECLNNCCS